MKARLFSITLLLFISNTTWAQNKIDVSPINTTKTKKEIKKEKEETKKNKIPQKGDIYFAPLPVLAVNPTFGVMYGLAASTSMFMGDPKTTRMSTSLGTLTYSTKKQLMFTFKSFIYSSQDNWILLGDMRYFDSSQPTYGLGTGPQSAKLAGQGIEYEEGMFSDPIPDAQLMKFKYIRFHETALKKFKKSLYFGLGYHLDYHYDIVDNLLNYPDTITSHYSYSIANGFNPERYTLSGLSLNALYDSRDNAATPYKGRYALMTFRYNPEFLGSSKNSSSLWLEYRDYFSLSKEKPQNLIALWTYANLQTSGSLPYMDLPAVGWDQFGRSGRAYTQGRFRGQSLLYFEVEYRFHIMGFEFNPDFIGGVVFVNATTASNKAANIGLFQFIDPGFGAGLRFMMDKTSRTNLTLDYAWGMYGSQGIYLNVNETF